MSYSFLEKYMYSFKMERFVYASHNLKIFQNKTLKPMEIGSNKTLFFNQLYANVTLCFNAISYALPATT